MSTWQERLIEEHAELDARGEKLVTFIMEEGGTYDTLPRSDQMYLVAQLAHMSSYCDVLEDRIDRL